MRCKDSRVCFGRDVDTNECNILTGELYPDGKCPFCKPKRNVSIVNGREVEFNDTKLENYDVQRRED